MLCSHTTRSRIRQIGPPAHHPVHRQFGTRFNDSGQRRALRRTQQGQLSRSLAADQPIRAARVEPQNPFGGPTVHWTVGSSASPHRLQPHAPGERRIPAAATRVNHRQSQKPAHLSRIPAAPRQPRANQPQNNSAEAQPLTPSQTAFSLPQSITGEPKAESKE